MANSVVISADALTQVGERTTLPAHTAKLAVNRFNQEISSIGTVWGEDKFGQEWANVYVPGLKVVQDSFRDIANGLLSLSGDFKVMAVLYENVEDANRG